ncbi:TPA: hypothetical protein I8Y34_004758 [Raoultella ornithinolytica]|nr:hypothetical protein [Raoultella ornithinolytica]
MTDITELSPAMKAAAEKYRLTLEAYRNNPRDYDTVVAWDEATSEFMELVDNDELNIISGLVEALEKAQQRIGELEGLLEVSQEDLSDTEDAMHLWAERARKAESEVESFRTAYMEWSDKTDWVNTDRRFGVVKPLGKHRADVLKAFIEHLEGRIAELGESNAQVIQSRDHYKRMTEEGLKQLAESRTVTVKLPPKIERDDADGWFMHKGGRVGGGAEMTTAGIKWEDE